MTNFELWVTLNISLLLFSTRLILKSNKALYRTISKKVTWVVHAITLACLYLRKCLLTEVMAMVCSYWLVISGQEVPIPEYTFFIVETSELKWCIWRCQQVTHFPRMCHMNSVSSLCQTNCISFKLTSRWCVLLSIEVVHEGLAIDHLSKYMMAISGFH